MQCTKCGADLQPGATVCPSCEERVVPTRKSVAAPRKRAATPAVPLASSGTPASSADVPAAGSARPSARPAWRVPALIAAVVVVIAVSGWVVSSVFSTGANTPEAAALRMMEAYANYDTNAFFANITHASLTATDVAAYGEAAAADKLQNKGAPLFKDIKVAKVTVDPKNPNAATVQLSEMILDPTKGTYAVRTDTLALVKQDGKWLVKLY